MVGRHQTSPSFAEFYFLGPGEKSIDGAMVHDPPLSFGVALFVVCLRPSETVELAVALAAGTLASSLVGVVLDKDLIAGPAFNPPGILGTQEARRPMIVSRDAVSGVGFWRGRSFFSSLLVHDFGDRNRLNGGLNGRDG